MPLPGGYNNDGNLTTDPASIIESQRPQPIGFWKGSGLSLVLNLLATVLSQGSSVSKVTKNGSESSVSQMFICIKLNEGVKTEALIEEIINYTKSSRTKKGKKVLYPGENMLRIREKSLMDAVCVDEKIWEKVKSL